MGRPGVGTWPSAADLPEMPTPQLDGTDLSIGLGVAVGAYLIGRLIGFLVGEVLLARGRSRSSAAIPSTALVPAVIDVLRRHGLEMPTDYGPITLVDAQASG